MKKKIMIMLLALFAMVPVTKAEGYSLGEELRKIELEREAQREAQERARKQEMQNDIMFGAIVFVIVAGGFFLVARGIRNRKDININSKKDIHIHKD